MTEEYIYVAVDETGNLGRSLKGERYYTLVACVVNDRERFEDATRRLGHSEEVKFNTHDGLREKVLEYAAPAISDVFYVKHPKKKGKPLGRYEQSELHLRMVRSLADSIILRYGYSSDLVVEIDHKDGVSDRMAAELFLDERVQSPPHLLRCPGFRIQLRAPDQRFCGRCHRLHVEQIGIPLYQNPGKRAETELHQIGERESGRRPASTLW